MSSLGSLIINSSSSSSSQLFSCRWASQSSVGRLSNAHLSRRTRHCYALRSVHPPSLSDSLLSYSRSPSIVCLIKSIRLAKMDHLNPIPRRAQSLQEVDLKKFSNVHRYSSNASPQCTTRSNNSYVHRLETHRETTQRNQILSK